MLKNIVIILLIIILLFFISNDEKVNNFISKKYFQYLFILLIVFFIYKDMNLFVILVLVIIFVATNLNLNLKDKMTNMAKYLDINIQENFIDRKDCVKKVYEKKIEDNTDMNKVDEKTDFNITPYIADQNPETNSTLKKDDDSDSDVRPFRLKVEEIKELYQNIKEQINNLST
jgi:hypothetical protein